MRLKQARRLRVATRRGGQALRTVLSPRAGRRISSRGPALTAPLPSFLPHAACTQVMKKASDWRFACGAAALIVVLVLVCLFAFRVIPTRRSLL